MKIVSIEEDVSFKLLGKDGYTNSYAGYVITLDDTSRINVGIEDGQCCCERWGYLTSSDDLQEFVGSEFISITMVDTPAVGVDLAAEDMQVGECMFVDVETSNGKLQFVCYNEHNGYYSHEAVVMSREFEHTENL